MDRMLGIDAYASEAWLLRNGPCSELWLTPLAVAWPAKYWALCSRSEVCLDFPPVGGVSLGLAQGCLRVGLGLAQGCVRVGLFRLGLELAGPGMRGGVGAGVLGQDRGIPLGRRGSEESERT